MGAKKKQKTNNKTSIVTEKPKVDHQATVVSQKTPWKLSIIVGIITLFISGLLYLQTLPYEYVLDDKIVVSENNFVKKGFAGISELLLTESFVGYFGEQKDLIPGARYRPLSLVTFAIEYGVQGKLNPRLSHLINVLLYGFCGWLVFLFLHQLFGIKKKWWLAIPFLVTVLWMFHPVHSEVVANIKGRDEIMSLLFSLICSLLAFKIHDTEKKSILWIFLLGVSFFLGLLSKENTLTFLAIIPASIYFFRKVNTKRLSFIVISLLVSFIGYLALRYSAVGYFISGKEVSDIMNNPFLGMNISEKMATVFYVLLKYLGLSYVPYPLTHDYYPYQIPKVSWANIFVLLSFIIHVTLVIYAILNFKKKQVWAYFIFFYVASLSIYSNIVINVGTTMNERFLYVATIPTCMALVYGLKKWLSSTKWSNIVVPSIVGLISLIYFLIAFNRTQVWESALTLNTAAVKVSTNSARANSFMATALFNQAKEMTYSKERGEILKEAMIYADKAIEIMPDYTNGNLMKAGIAGELHKMDGNLDNLLASFEIVSINKPSISFIHEYIDYIKDRYNGDQKLMDFFYRVGYEELILNKGDNKWGLKFLNYAYDMSPNDPKINYAISQGYRFEGDDQKADLFLQRTLSIDPSYQNR